MTGEQLVTTFAGRKTHILSPERHPRWSTGATVCGHQAWPPSQLFEVRMRRGKMLDLATMPKCGTCFR